MNKIPVVNVARVKGILLDVDEILYLSVAKNEIRIHTQHGIFVPPLSIYDWSLALQSSGFEQLQKSNLVNLSKISRYDLAQNIVFFDIPNAPSLGCAVSRRNRYKLKRFFDDRM